MGRQARMNTVIPYKKAVCYSGYRRGQSPAGGKYPSYGQIREDLHLLVKEGFGYIRMYDPNEHAQMALRAIKEESLPLKAMVGIDPAAEINNPGCPWDKRVRSREELLKNRKRNDGQLRELIALAKEYEPYMLAVSVGNENRPSWGSDLVETARLVEMAKCLKAETALPVTYNEGAYEWLELAELVEVLDVISIHSYPQWHKKPVEEALDMNRSDYGEITRRYPDKQVIFTECGWTTQASGEGMIPEHANEENQKLYIRQLCGWTEKEKITAFLFEAFDEPWKGGTDEKEPEKHWGLFREDRTPKYVLRQKDM